MKGLKRKYHRNYSRSAEYAAREAEAYLKLLRNFAKDDVYIVRSGVGVMNTGIVDGFSSSAEDRFDFVLVDLWTKKVICYVEVTGDALDDEFAYVLSEKIEKAKRAEYPVFILYNKKRKRMWRVLSAKYVATHGELKKWLKDEKPYYVVPVSKGLYFADWVRWMKSHVIKAIRDAVHPSIYEKYVKSWVIR